MVINSVDLVRWVFLFFSFFGTRVTLGVLIPGSKNGDGWDVKGFRWGPHPSNHGDQLLESLLSKFGDTPRELRG